MSSSSLKKKTGRAALWQVGGGMWQAIVRLSGSIVLARVLTPSDFGLFGMAILAQNFLVYMGALGMGSALVAKADISHDDVCTCFWTMAGVRVILFLISYFSAPLVALFFRQEQLVSLIRAISLVFLFSIPEIGADALLIKKMRFATINIIRGMGIFIETSLAVILATTRSMGYWSLVAGMLANASFCGICILISSGWFPSLRFKKKSFSWLFSFGINSLGHSFMNYLSQNLDYLVVGRLLGSASLGIYEFAYRIPHLIHLRLVQPVSGALFPAFAKVQEDDFQLMQGYINSTYYLCMMVLPPLFALAATSDVVVPLMWGNQWVAAILPMKIFCFLAAARAITYSGVFVLYAKNRPDIAFKISAMGLLATAIGVYVGGVWYGLIGVSLAMSLSILSPLFIVRYCFKITHVDPALLFKAISPVVISASILYGVCYGMKNLLLYFDAPIFILLPGIYLTGILVFFSFIYLKYPRLFHDVGSLVKHLKG